MEAIIAMEMLRSTVENLQYHTVCFFELRDEKKSYKATLLYLQNQKESITKEIRSKKRKKIANKGKLEELKKQEKMVVAQMDQTQKSLTKCKDRLKGTRKVIEDTNNELNAGIRTFAWEDKETFVLLDAIDWTILRRVKDAGVELKFTIGGDVRYQDICNMVKIAEREGFPKIQPESIYKIERGQVSQIYYCDKYEAFISGNWYGI